MVVAITKLDEGGAQFRQEKISSRINYKQRRISQPRRP